MDLELVRRGIARSRAHASEMITRGEVRVTGMIEPKPSSLVDASTAIAMVGPPPTYVGRGGLKLEAALETFSLDVTGVRALDAGASTGGFTDCLLQHGAGSVVAVDVGYGQLDDRLAGDPRVTVVDRTNIRYVAPSDLGGTFDLVVADLSFISLCTVAPALARLAGPGGDLVLLVKPQFEVGKGQVGRGGIVADPALRQGAVEKVEACLSEHGMGTLGVIESPIEGAKGNREFLLWAKRDAQPNPDRELVE